MAKKSVKKSSGKNGKNVVGYIIGMLSIVFAIFNPLVGVVLGIIGLNKAKEKGELSEKARKYSLIGLILGAVLFIVALIIAIYFPDLMQVPAY